MTTEYTTSQNYKVSPRKNSETYYDDQMKIIWEQNHPPDIKQVQNWKSWEVKK